jgi:hypothetical protein
VRVRSHTTISGYGKKQSKAGNKQTADCYMLQAGFLLDLLFRPEDGGDILI